MAAAGKAEIRALMLRLPKDLHRRLVQGTKKSKRSLNAEILWRLTLSFYLESELERADTTIASLRDAIDAVLRQASELQKMGPLGIGAGLGLFGFGGAPGGPDLGIKGKGGKK